MTPAERALLLDLASRINACRDWSDRPHLLKLIVAVEAEALAEYLKDNCADLAKLTDSEAASPYATTKAAGNPQ